MRIVEFNKQTGSRDIYEYFEDLATKHELEYFNAVRTPDGAAFGFINEADLDGRATDEDMKTFKKYLVYEITLETSEAAVRLYDRFEDLLEDHMPAVKSVYCYEGDRFIAVFNSIDTNPKPLKFEENYEMTLRNMIIQAK